MTNADRWLDTVINGQGCIEMCKEIRKRAFIPEEIRSQADIQRALEEITVTIDLLKVREYAILDELAFRNRGNDLTFDEWKELQVMMSSHIEETNSFLCDIVMRNHKESENNESSI